MIQKVLKVGSSAAVTIPKKALAELGLKPGDSVLVSINANKRSVLVVPTRQASKHTDDVTRFTMSFIKRYRKDLEALKDK